MDFNAIEEAGLTQSEFAQLVGSSRGTVNNWVRGRSSPTNAYQKACKSNLLLIQVAMRMYTLPGSIPTIYKGNMDSRKEYISASLKKAAEYIRTHTKK